MSYKKVCVLCFSNGVFGFTEGDKFKVRTVAEAPEEDWKTAMVHKIKPIPSDTELVVNNVLTNFYGRYLEVSYNGRNYNIDPRYCDYVRSVHKETEDGR